MVVSIRPSDFASDPKPLDLKDKKAIEAIHKMSFIEFNASYFQPPTDKDAYLHITRVPVAWRDYVEQMSRSHLFLYSFCLASANDLVRDNLRLRAEVKKQCRVDGNDAYRLLLSNRPWYAPSLIVDESRWNFPTWSWDVKSWLVNLAEELRVSARQLLIVYSIKAMIAAGVDLGGDREKMVAEVSKWEEHLSGENDQILRISSLV